MFRTILKILTFPIWFPIKVLWFISKVLAVVILIGILILLVYGYVTMH